ncbi:MAG: redox-regulated ATPase YchF, partial [Chloroflexi bacterium]|nr:redox-regulated ATPase YchF [Chloroflexota bacterium]
ALTRGHGAATGGGGAGAETHVGVVKVPDPRLTKLAEMYQPKKVVYAEIKYWDLPGSDAPTQSNGIGGRNRNILQGVDAFLIVVRAFTNPAVHHHLGGVDPSRDLAAMLDELALGDLEVMERAVERQEDGIKKCKPAERPVMVRQLEAVRKVKQGLEEGIPLRLQKLTPSESEILAAYQFLTGKPVIVVFNTDEAGPESTLSQLGLNLAAIRALGEVSMCGKLEEDLALMSDEEEREFREELGVGEQAMSKVIRASYETLGLVSFLTIGDDEVRAWSVPAGLAAQEAAGSIHTDFYRGFIRAEVIPFDDLARCGSISQCRKEGVLRLEGKTYPVKDGDVIDFLVNV